eukprot:TRINITY_DN17712_c0_g1_i1.p3 TRINITY_DN17712_c0_g1~~TRINITY_DN17712_c0_g1_i1.p3  ORF type:complete len:165 (+),score=13.81 TRINITY_DN17712_c0_g1_i1:207-701(+)
MMMIKSNESSATSPTDRPTDRSSPAALTASITCRLRAPDPGKSQTSCTLIAKPVRPPRAAQPASTNKPLPNATGNRAERPIRLRLESGYKIGNNRAAMHPQAGGTRTVEEQVGPLCSLFERRPPGFSHCGLGQNRTEGSATVVLPFWLGSTAHMLAAVGCCQCV